MTADGVGCQEHALEQGVRVPLEDVAVLEGPGLALVRVDYQILWFGRLLRDEGPLSTSQKSGPAQTAQPGFGDLAGHLFRSHGSKSLPGRQISAVSDIVFEPAPVRIFEARGEHRPI